MKDSAENGVLVAGRRWSSNRASCSFALEGQNIEELLSRAVSEMGCDDREVHAAALLEHCQCRLNGYDVPREVWRDIVPVSGDRLEFLIAPGKGSGKNPLALVLQLVVAVAVAVAVPVFSEYLIGAGFSKALAGGIAGSVGMVALAGSSMLINSLFPVAHANKQDQGDSRTYSLTGGQNAASPDGYVPLILGSYRIYPPLGAKSWTSYEGDEQFFHMLVIWGHAGINVAGVRIGETPIGSYADVQHYFHKATRGGSDLVLFGKSYTENAEGAVISHAAPVVRTVGLCDELSFDIMFGAIGESDEEDGGISPVSVTFTAHCREENSETWLPIGGSSFQIPEAYGDVSGTIAAIVVDRQGHVGIRTDEEEEMSSQYLEIWPEKSEYITGCEATVETATTAEQGESAMVVRRKTRTTWHVAPGQCVINDGQFEISGAQSKPLTRTYSTCVPVRGVYEIRVTRVTEDRGGGTVYDEASLAVTRAILHRPAFETPVEVCCSELRIRATEQLNGYVQTLNGLCTLETEYAYDRESGGWKTGTTSNPSDCILHLLKTRNGINEPFPDSRIDWKSFRKFAIHCENNGYTFNFVADSETNVWQRITQVASAGRGAVTLDNDGRIGIVMDTAWKTPVQMFTPRNSWGFSVKRTFAKVPHALRAKYYDAESNYEEKNGFVYADGYAEHAAGGLREATNIVEWESVGKTNWEEVWKFGRYYLASAKLRQSVVTLSTDWEWRLCSRGDLVAVAHDVLMNTLGVARVESLIYSGKMVSGVVLDDTVTFPDDDAEERYGVAIRKAGGAVMTAEVEPQLGVATDILMFTAPLSAAQAPSPQDLVSVATFGSEYGEYLVSSVTPGEDMSAELTLIPYASEIMAADSGEVPDPPSPVILDVIPRSGALPAPVVKKVESGDAVIDTTGSGETSITCLAAWWALPSSPDTSSGDVVVELEAKDGNGNVFSASCDLSTPYAIARGVVDGRTYSVRMRLSSGGRYSRWSSAVFHQVTGRTISTDRVQKAPSLASI